MFLSRVSFCGEQKCWISNNLMRGGVAWDRGRAGGIFSRRDRKTLVTLLFGRIVVSRLIYNSIVFTNIFTETSSWTLSKKTLLMSYSLYDNANTKKIGQVLQTNVTVEVELSL